MSDDADLKAYMERHPNFNINEFFYNAGYEIDHLECDNNCLPDSHAMTS